MKKILILSAVVSLILFSGCDFFSGKNSVNEDIKVNENTEIQQEAATEEKVLPQADAQNEPADNVKVDVKESTVSEINNNESAEVKLAKCLTEKGVELYTSSTCPHCKDQKELFKDGLQFLINNECLAMDGWSQDCIDKEIKYVPTWIFADGQMTTGTTPLEKLAEKTGCEYQPAIAG